MVGVQTTSSVSQNNISEYSCCDTDFNEAKNTDDAVAYLMITETGNLNGQGPVV